LGSPYAKGELSHNEKTDPASFTVGSLGSELFDGLKVFFKEDYEYLGYA